MVSFVAVLDGNIKYFATKKAMLDFVSNYAKDSCIDSVMLFKCKFYKL